MALEEENWRCTRTFQHNASTKTGFKELKISLVSNGISRNKAAYIMPFIYLIVFYSSDDDLFSFISAGAK